MKKADMKAAKDRIIFAITENENSRVILNKVADDIINLMSRKIKSLEEFKTLIMLIYLSKLLASILKEYDEVDNQLKEITSENISLDFINPRNEDVRILIPNTNDNNINQLTFFLQNNVDYICSAKSTCSITFNMIIKEQSPLNDKFSFYLPVTLLNEREFTKFININQYDKYKDTAMKYLTNRVYINYLINGQITK